MEDWPEELPIDFLVEGFYEEMADNCIETQMDAGTPKARPRSSAVRYPMGGNMVVTEAQWPLLQGFYKGKTRAIPFRFPHPTSGEVVAVKFAKPPGRKPRTPGRYTVNIDLWVQP